MGFINLTIEGNDGASDLESRIKTIKNNDDLIQVLQEEIVSEYSRWNTPGFINVAIVLAHSNIDFTGNDKLLNYFVPRLKNLLQESIQNVKEIDQEMAQSIKQLLLALINKHREFAFKEIA